MRIARVASFIAICGMALIFTGSFSTARAADCDISTPLANLQTVENDSSLSDHDRLVQELGIRKQILKDIVGCATQNASSLQNNLKYATTSNDVANHLQMQFANQLDNSLSYYNLKGSMIDNLGLQGTKDFSNDLETWREDSEIPLETQISAFLLWNQNQPIFAAAINRFAQINHVIASLDLSDDQNITKDLLDAKNQLANAKGFNSQAENLVQNNDVQDTMLDITDSLNALKNVYEDFFLLSGLVQNAFTSK